MEDEELEELEEIDNLDRPQKIVGQNDGERLRNTLDRGRNQFRKYQNLNTNNHGNRNQAIKKQNATNRNKPNNEQITKKLGKKNSANNANAFLSGIKSTMPFIGRKKQNNDINSSTSNESAEENEENTSGSASATLKKSIRIIKIIKILSFVIPIVLFIIGIVFVVFTVTSFFGKIVSFFTPNKDDLDQESEYYTYASTYYDRLDEAKNAYLKKCDIVLDPAYIHAVLAYPMIGNDDIEDDVMYQAMGDNLYKVTDMMVDDDCNVDYNIGGYFYSKLRDSSFFKIYYSENLKNDSEDEILEEVFKYAKEISEMDSEPKEVTNGGLAPVVVSNDINVVVTSCDNKTTSNVSFRDYIKGVMYMEIGDLITNENMELLKSYAVSITSHTLYKTGYNSSSSTIKVSNGSCFQMYCDINKGCSYVNNSLYDGFSSSNATFNKGALSSEKNDILNKALDSVFGNVVTDKNGTIKDITYSSSYVNTNCDGNCISKNSALNDAHNGLNYSQIIDKYSDDSTVSNAKEDSYVTNVIYRSGGYTDEVIYYRQKDYKNTFCGVKGATISSHGCGTTSMSMILATLVDRSYNPVNVMEEAHSFGLCDRSGTYAGFFKKSANKHNLGYASVSKYGNMQTVINALKSGNSLVIAHMGAGTFTNSGHYIVLSNVNEKGEVYVLDPNNKDKNGWYSLNNVIVKQLYGSLYIITKG